MGKTTSKDLVAKLEAAKNPNTPEETIKKLAKDEDNNVR
jgi:hypothetical protein